MRCIFRAMSGWAKLARWSLGDFRSRSRSRLHQAWQKNDVTRAIIVPRRAFLFLRERSNCDTFFFIHPTHVAYPGSRKPRGDLCIESSSVPHYSIASGIFSIIGHRWKYENDIAFCVGNFKLVLFLCEPLIIRRMFLNNNNQFHPWDKRKPTWFLSPNNF